jgi:hypothetical protein
MARRKSTRRLVEFSAAAFVGVDETNPFRGPAFLRVSQNMMPDGIFGGSWCTRPGFGDPNNLSGAPSLVNGRGIRQLSTTAGNEWTAWFIDGRFYLGAFQTAPTNITLSGGVVITNTAPTVPAKFLIGSTTFRDKFIVTDQVTEPWMYAPDTATFTLLGSAPVARGVPTVYYGKVFFIKDSSPITIVWSEEGDPTTGYEDGGYNNAWDLAQVSGEPITAILGTNDALFFWRQSAFDMIRGEVDENFSTSGTVSGISSHIGTKSAHAVLLIGRTIWFLDQFGYPHRYQIGGEIEPIYKAAQSSLRFVYEAGLPMASAAHFEAAGAVVFLIPADLPEPSAPNIANIALAFDDSTGAYLGTWNDNGEIDDYSLKTLDAHVIGAVKRTHTWRMAHIGGTSQPRTYVWQLPGSNADTSSLGYYEDRATSGSGQPIVSHMVPGPLGESPDHKVFDRIIASVAGGQTVTNLKIGYVTAEGTAPAAQTVAVAGINDQGSGLPWAVPQAEQRVVVGTFARTRWAQPYLSHATISEVLSVNSITVRGVTDTADPWGT